MPAEGRPGVTFYKDRPTRKTNIKGMGELAAQTFKGTSPTSPSTRDVARSVAAGTGIAGALAPTGKVKKAQRSGLLRTLLLGGVFGAGSYGLSRGLSALEERAARGGKQKAFNAMLGEDSDLKRLNKSSPAKVKSHFNTLFRFNPEMAKDPMVASSFVKGTVQLDTIPHKSVEGLISARKAMHETGRRLHGMPNFPNVPL